MNTIDPAIDKPLPDSTTSSLIFSVLAVPVLIFGLCIVRSYVISTLWGWYVVPFFSMQPMPMVIAFGLSLMISYLTPFNHTADTRTSSAKIQYAIYQPLVAILLGYIGTLFM